MPREPRLQAKLRRRDDARKSSKKNRKWPVHSSRKAGFSCKHVVKCPYCNKDFVTSKKNAQYCCRSHYNAAYYQRKKDALSRPQ